MKRIWKDGTKAIVLSPLDFIARLCALVPPPYFHLTRFHGLLAPNSKYRAEVVPQREQLPSPAQQLQLFDANESGTQDKASSGSRHRWAWLLKRVFRVDITVCPRCQGSLKIIELVSKRDEIAKRLAHAGLGPMPPPKPLPSVPGQLALRFDLDKAATRVHNQTACPLRGIGTSAIQKDNETRARIEQLRVTNVIR